MLAIGRYFLYLFDKIFASPKLDASPVSESDHAPASPASVNSDSWQGAA
ncbi:MAG: hypothetical protein ABSD13_15575 [Candidatus Korobacteraceae bacterium]|jgi:hypothetical protein